MDAIYLFFLVFKMVEFVSFTFFEFKSNITFITYRDIYKLFLALENDKVAAQVANIDLQKKAAKLLHREKVSTHSSFFFFFHLLIYSFVYFLIDFLFIY